MSISDDVRAGNARLNAAIAAGDAGALANLYTDGGRLLADGAPRLDGRSAIEDFFKEAVDAGFTSLVLETLDVIDAGDVAIEIGRWSNPTKSGDVGEYVVVWKRDSGELKIEVDIFNSDWRPD